MSTTKNVSGPVYAFGEFELDTRMHELRRAGAVCHIEPQVFDLLAYLVARRDRLVTKDELLQGVWGHRFVAPTTLNSRIKIARQALGDDGSSQRVIKTVHGRGFRFIANVEERGTEPIFVDTRVEQSIRFCTSADGVRIAYAKSGVGPPLLKPANWLTHLEYDWESPVWRHWLRALSREHTLIRYDERGSGLSDRDAADLSFDAWVRDLETVVDELGLERFPIFALSQGCAVAITYAVRHPERVSRMILYGGFTEGRIRRARTPQQLEEMQMITRALPLGWGRDNPAYRQFFASMFIPEGTPEQQRWFSELQRMSTTPEIAVQLLETAANIDVSELARCVQAPTLVLHAVGDAVVPFNQGRQLAALIPGARFVPLDGRNHVLLEHEPAWPRFVQEVSNFLSET